MHKLFLISVLLLPAFSSYAQFVAGAFKTGAPHSNNNIEILVSGSLYKSGSGGRFPGEVIFHDPTWGETKGTAFFQPVSFSGAVMKFKSSPDNPIGTSNTGSCYIRGYSSFYLASKTGGFIAEDGLFKGTEVRTGGEISDSYIKINKSCSLLTPKSPEVAGLQISAPPFTGNMLEGSSFSDIPELRVLRGLTVYQPYTYAANIGSNKATIISSVMILACGTVATSTSTCTTSKSATGSNAITPPKPNVTCLFNFPTEITIDNVSATDYLNKVASINIPATCSSTTNIQFQVADNGIVNVGPFKVQTTFDDKINPSLPINSNGTTNVKFSAEITGTNQKVTGGLYTGVVVIVTSLI